VDPRRPGHLGESRQGFLHVPRGHQHEVGQFVDDNDDIGEAGQLFLFRLLVVSLDALAAHVADEGIAPLHLLHRPFEHLGCLLGIHNHGMDEMGNPFVGGKLDSLRIDHEELDLFGGGAEEDAADHGVKGDAFSRSRGAGDEEMGHAGQILDHGGAHDIHPQGDGELAPGPAEDLGIQDVPQVHRLPFQVGDFDADHRLSRQGGDDADTGRLQGQGEIVRQIGDPVDLDPRCRFQFV